MTKNVRFCCGWGGWVEGLGNSLRWCAALGRVAWIDIKVGTNMARS